MDNATAQNPSYVREEMLAQAEPPLVKKVRLSGFVTISFRALSTRS